MRGLKAKLPAYSTPRLDLGGCVFYAPLWRPDMVARGGSIVNGTGTMDVSPQVLAVGANTITVTVAGNLIVSMPEGGTVASGTMTVSGSPVTVSAGIATTITTTGAIGNITCTPSNIIRSKDKNNHAMTVTGATWGSQGRTFDGTDDKIITTSTVSIIPVYTAIAWIKIDTNADPLTFLSFGNSAAPDELASRALRIRFANEAGAWSSVSTLRSINTWYHIALVRDNTNNWIKIYVDGVLYTNEAYVTDLMEDPVEFQVGCLNKNASPAQFFDGTIGEALVYNRALTLAEIQRNYQRTKWRYV